MFLCFGLEVFQVVVVTGGCGCRRRVEVLVEVLVCVGIDRVSRFSSCIKAKKQMRRVSRTR